MLFRSLGILRGHDTVSAEIVVGAPADRLDRLSEGLDPQKSLIRRLSVLAVSVDDRVSTLLPDLRLPFGVVVLGRAQRSRGINTPLVAGDVIHAVNGAAVGTFQQLTTAMNELEPNSSVALQIERGGRLMFVSFALE